MEIKQWLAYGAGGVSSVLVGGYIKPMVDKTLSMIPNFMVLGSSLPHDLVSYGAGFFVGLMAYEWLKK